MDGELERGGIPGRSRRPDFGLSWTSRVLTETLGVEAETGVTGLTAGPCRYAVAWDVGCKS